MQYLRNTRNMTLTIEPGDEPKWWVDSLYTVQPDMKNHTGIYMTLGKGATYMASCKIPKVQQRQNWWLWMMQWDKCCGPYIFWPHKDTPYQHNNIPRQQEHNTTSRKWRIFKFKENMTHQRTILLHNRHDKKRRSQSSLLPHYEHAWGLKYNTDKNSAKHRSVLDNEEISTRT